MFLLWSEYNHGISRIMFFVKVFVFHSTGSYFWMKDSDIIKVYSMKSSTSQYKT